MAIFEGARRSASDAWAQREDTGLIYCPIRRVGCEDDDLSMFRCKFHQSGYTRGRRNRPIVKFGPSKAGRLWKFGPSKVTVVVILI